MITDIKEYLHYYIGHPCVDSWFPEGHEQYKNDWVFNGIMITSEKPYYIENAKEYTWTDSIKPILRRLESLTEDEMIALLQSMIPADMEDKPTAKDYSVEMFHNDGGNLVNGNVVVGAEYTCRCYIGEIAIRKCGSIDFYDEDGEKEKNTTNLPQGYHWLLSHGFDLFSLIDNNLAVDAATI